MKYGHPNDPRKDLISEIKTVRKLGFDYCELFVEHPGAMPGTIEKKKDVVKKELEKFGHPPLAHLDWRADLAAPYPAVREAWIETCKSALDVCADVGADKMTIHLSHFSSTESEDDRKKMLDAYAASLKDLAIHGESAGCVPILENIPGRNSDLDSMLHVLKKARIGVNLDVAHAFIMSMKRTEFLDYFRKLKKDIVHIHVHDNNGVEDEHLPIGEGLIDFGDVREELEKIGYDKTATLEVYTSKKDAAASVKKLREMWK